jgi:hypothetical protein
MNQHNAGAAFERMAIKSCHGNMCNVYGWIKNQQ